MTAPTKRLAFLVTAEMTATHFLGGYVEYLRTHGWDVDVVTRSEGALEAWGAEHGVTTTSIPFVREPSLLADAGALLRVWRHLRASKPDLVVAATPKASLLGMLAARLAGVRHRAYLAWGLRLETSTGLARRVFAALERLTVSSSTLCLANSASLARRMEELGLAPAGTIEVPGHGSSHGVDLVKFNPSFVGEPDEATATFLRERPADLTLVFVGRLNPDKGIDTLLTALDRCLEQKVSVRLVIVGPAEGWDAEAISPRVAEAVHVAGSQADVRPYIAAADALCLPSRREGFPNVVLEAAAMGKPAIVSDATGCIDSVVDGTTGLIFKMGDADALATATVRLAGDRALRAELARRGRDRVEQEFDQQMIWRAYVDRFDMEIHA